MTVRLDGSASSDANADVLTYAWTLTSRPVGSAARPSFLADQTGTYVVSLTVNDGKVNSVPATVVVTATAGIAGLGTWETTLHARDFNADGTIDAYYDSTLNISWLANANAAVGTKYDTVLATIPQTTGSDGLLIWPDALKWAAELSVHGITGWRLPKVNEANFPATVPVNSSEMASMYYRTLGNRAAPDPSARNTGPFVGLRLGRYWSDTQNSGYLLECWVFDLESGVSTVTQCLLNFGWGSALPAWAVRDGDVVTALAQQR